MASEKFVHALFLDGFLVFYHAHTIADLVELVEFSQTIAGHVWALVAEAELLADFSWAVTFDKRTFFISDSAAAAVGNGAFFGWDATAVGEV